MRKFTIFLILILFSAINASADDKKFYVSGTVGALFESDAELMDSTTVRELVKTHSSNDLFRYSLHSNFYDSNALFDMSASMIGAFGVNVSSNVRTEIEYGYRHLNVSDLNSRVQSFGQMNEEDLMGDWCDNQNCSPDANIHNMEFMVDNEYNEKAALGNIKMHTAMANAFYDIKSKNSTFFPYVGGGLGIAILNYNIHAENNESIDEIVYLHEDDNTWSNVRQQSSYKPHLLINKTRTKIAYQLMGGISWKINDSIIASAGYRYFSVGDVFDTHSVETGIRYQF